MAAAVEIKKMRPNIRIEIHNNVTENEKMDVDESDNEEGEIIDNDEISTENVTLENSSPPVMNKIPPAVTKDVFTTGINIFDKQVQEKLQERAKRFALKPDEIRNFTDADLEELYESLGITSENESNVRFEAVHMLGTNKMVAEDILEYFAKYAPTGIEWVDDDSCNVTWVENISAARAMFYASKAVRGMPAREPVDTFVKEFLDDVEEPDDGTGKSILLKNREVQLKVDEVTLSSANKVNFKNSVDISEITVPIPPGYWRLGAKHPKAKSLLLKFAFKTDKKPYKVENLSKYYKKLGNSRGIIDERNKRELKGIFERNRELNQEKNPWGSLAKNWDKDAKFREPERDPVDPKTEIKNPGLLVRLGKKNELAAAEKEDDDDDVEIIESRPPKVRIPRMRMYADEEEEKLRRKKLLQTIKRHTEKLLDSDHAGTTDLRNVLRLNNKVPDDEVIEIDADSDEPDLGAKLKNRAKQMVFTVERDNHDKEYYERKENRSDARSFLDNRRAHSPVRRRRQISPPRRSPNRRRSPRYRSRSPITRYSSPARRRSPASRHRSSRHRRSPERTLHSDRIHSRHRQRRRHSDYSEEEERDPKPKSKVAVVVRKPRKPTVASTIWSRVRYSDSESSSKTEYSGSEESSSGSSSSESESESEEESDSSSSSARGRRRVERPGFRGGSRDLTGKVNHRTPLKITMANDRYKR